jgi:hypothetical protein
MLTLWFTTAGLAVDELPETRDVLFKLSHDQIAAIATQITAIGVVFRPGQDFGMGYYILI